VALVHINLTLNPLSGSLALSLPHTAARTIYKHFRNVEWQMKSMEDEEMEKREMEMMEARYQTLNPEPSIPTLICRLPAFQQNPQI